MAIEHADLLRKDQRSPQFIEWQPRHRPLVSTDFQTGSLSPWVIPAHLLYMSSTVQVDRELTIEPWLASNSWFPCPSPRVRSLHDCAWLHDGLMSPLVPSQPCLRPSSLAFLCSHLAWPHLPTPDGEDWQPRTPLRLVSQYQHTEIRG